MTLALIIASATVGFILGGLFINTIRMHDVQDIERIAYGYSKMAGEYKAELYKLKKKK